MAAQEKRDPGNGKWKKRYNGLAKKAWRTPAGRGILPTMKAKKIAVIGGTAGMGLALAREACSLGAEVLIGGRNAERLAKVAAELGVRGMVIDTMDEDSVSSFFQEAGMLDHLATPGSSVRTGTLRETPLEDLHFSVHNKFVGQALCAKHAKIREGGSITFFSGMLAERPGSSPLLGAINAAVETLARGLAVELAPVRVNVVSPGLTRNTEAFAGMSEDAREAMFRGAAAKLPAGRVGEPADMAAAAIFLMQNRFVTGQVVVVDGGACSL